MSNAFFGALLFFYNSQCHVPRPRFLTDRERGICAQVAMQVDPDYMPGGIHAPRDWAGH